MQSLSAPLPLTTQSDPDDESSGYYLNPANAIQIDPPSAMDESDMCDISKRIEATSAEYHNRVAPAPAVVNDIQIRL